jgi:NitT/TauT family transport system ATP-binding protein
MRLEVNHLGKEFPKAKGGTLKILDDITFSSSEEESIGILGPSGCGKTTLLRIIAGLEKPSVGEVLLDGSSVDSPNPKMGMIFQEYSLLPWLTVAENVSIGLEIRKASEEERREKVERYLSLVGLQGVAENHPYELSGGMRQRVAVARSLTLEPAMLLMDEPFAALDPLTRGEIQESIIRLKEATGKTIILVTHSIEEAVFLADRLVILSANPGRIHKIIPVDLKRPRDRASEEFVRLRIQVLNLLSDLAVASKTGR